MKHRSYQGKVVYLTDGKGEMGREYDAGDTMHVELSERYNYDATNAWHKLRPSYYLSPEKWWKLLLRKQMQGAKWDTISPRPW